MRAVVELPMSDAMRGITLDLTITGVRRARARIWLGGCMLRAAAWLMGCDIEVSAEITDGPAPSL